MQHRSRRLALQGLCCVDAQGASAWKLIDHFIADSKENLQVVHSARKLLRAAFDAHQECDRLLKKHARRWELSRLALVDRNILRLATHELLENETPFKVIISESLKLAREFSTAESPRFVNGVLDAIARDLRRQRGEEDLPVPQGKKYPKPEPETTEEPEEKTPEPIRKRRTLPSRHRKPAPVEDINEDQQEDISDDQHEPRFAETAETREEVTPEPPKPSPNNDAARQAELDAMADFDDWD